MRGNVERYLLILGLDHARENASKRDSYTKLLE